MHTLQPITASQLQTNTLTKWINKPIKERKIYVAKIRAAAGLSRAVLAPPTVMRMTLTEKQAMDNYNSIVEELLRLVELCATHGHEK